MNQDTSIKWKVSDVFNVFVLTFVLELLLYVLIQAIGLPDFVKIISDNILLKGIILLFMYLLQVAGMLFPLWFFIIRKYASRWKDFAFKWIGTGKTILWIIMAYLFFLGLSILLIIIFFSLGIEALGFEKQSSIFEIFGTDPFGIFIAVLIALVIAPVVEEIFFRGFVLQTLAKRISPFWGVVLTALIFASVHFEFQSIMPLLILSVVLNVIFVKTKSIWPGILFHVFNNTISFIALYFIESGYYIVS
ncbi:lysostaphin resistance A-like protein [Patescibacteria group bacterium]